MRSLASPLHCKMQVTEVKATHERKKENAEERGEEVEV
jgi:hypothetical protein